MEILLLIFAIVAVINVIYWAILWILKLIRKIYKQKLRSFMTMIVMSFIFVSLLFGSAAIVAATLNWPPIRSVVADLLSFTSDHELISSYIEFWGTIVGTVLAIFGALFTERRIKAEESAELAERETRTLARIIYYDLKLAAEDMDELYSDISKEKHLSSRSIIFSEMEKAYESKSRQLYFDSNWIVTVSEYSKYLPEDIVNDRVRTLFRYYGYMMDINNGTKVSERLKCFISDEESDEYNKNTLAAILKELENDADISKTTNKRTSAKKKNK